MDKKISNLYLGTGTLSWHSEERVSDRYGTIFLFNYHNEHDTTQLLDIPLIKRFNGSLGSLKASVVNTRTSTHLGDLFRNLRPITPTVNELIMLGSGYLFYEEYEDTVSIGLRPVVKRASDWLNPQALYKCHHQDVELYFHLENTLS